MSISPEVIPFPRRIGPFVVLMSKSGGMRIRIDSIVSFHEQPARKNDPQSRLGTQIRTLPGQDFWSVHSLTQIDELMQEYYGEKATELDYADLPY